MPFLTPKSYYLTNFSKSQPQAIWHLGQRGIIHPDKLTNYPRLKQHIDRYHAVLYYTGRPPLATLDQIVARAIFYINLGQHPQYYQGTPWQVTAIDHNGLTYYHVEVPTNIVKSLAIWLELQHKLSTVECSNMPDPHLSNLGTVDILDAQIAEYNYKAYQKHNSDPYTYSYLCINYNSEYELSIEVVPIGKEFHFDNLQQELAKSIYHYNEIAHTLGLSSEQLKRLEIYSNANI